jgi:hypothetical protein
MVSRYARLEDPPTDGTDEPEAEKIPEPPNIVSDEIEVATEEDLQRIIEQEGMVLEPEIAAFELVMHPTRGEAQAVSRSYISEYPTSFNWRADVARLVNRIQRKFPWQTFANTYYMHPPLYGRKYERVSVDFWGGGRSNGRYVGYRGKPIGTSLGQRVFNAIFHDPYEPNIFWIIWNGRMWMRGTGWGPSPWGPPDSDAGHHEHIHVTYLLPAGHPDEPASYGEISQLELVRRRLLLEDLSQEDIDRSERFLTITPSEWGSGSSDVSINHDRHLYGD